MNQDPIIMENYRSHVPILCLDGRKRREEYKKRGKERKYYTFILLNYYKLIRIQGNFTKRVKTFTKYKINFKKGKMMVPQRYFPFHYSFLPLFLSNQTKFYCVKL